MRTLGDLLEELARATRSTKPITAETVATYIVHLADVPAEVMEAAVIDLIRTEEWFPAIARIRRACAEVALALPTEGDALAQIEARMRWARLPEDDRPEQPEVHPAVREALDHVGGFPALRMAEDQAVVRGQFGRLYREQRAHLIHEAQTGNLPGFMPEYRGLLGPGSGRPTGPVS